MIRGLVAGALVWALFPASPAPPSRPRARDLGVTPGRHTAGRLNAITDVAGVRVGHTTLIAGDRIRTGVTAILAHGGNLFQEKVAAGVFVGNAFGKLAGSTQVEELGTLETPIVLTNTLAVGRAMDAIVGWTLAQPGNETVRSVNAVVGETNDGWLNDIRARPITPEHVTAAIERASPGVVQEGAVGAGTGTVCFGWKGGIGTASRVLPIGEHSWTVGVLVQTNFGGSLVMDGVPVGRLLAPPARAAGAGDSRGPRAREERADRPGRAPVDGSCMIVVATDAPIDARDLGRLAARAVFGLARSGSSYSHASGDYAIAFTTSPELRVLHGETAPRTRTILPSEGISPLFEAALEATEEAVYNSLLQAETMTGNGHTVPAIPIEELRTLLAGRRQN